jgi:hypothetical protein
MELHRVVNAARRLAAPVVALVLVAAAPAGNAPDPAAGIAAAAGHPALLNLRAETTHTRAGRTATATLYVSAGQRLERECIDDLCGGSWFDGDHYATFGINGTPFPQAADDGRERTFAAIASTAFGEPSFVAAGGQVVRLPDDGTLDRERYAVRAPRGSELIAIADARSERLLAVDLPDGSPYRALVASALGPPLVYATQAYDRAVATSTPPAPPRGPHLVVSDGPPLALVSPDLPIAPCHVAGLAATCLIDTGTSPSAITLEFAERLGQEPHGQIEIAGLGHYLTGIIATGPLRIGGATLDRLELAVIPRVRGVHFDVILGSDALAGMRLAIDRPHDRLRVEATQTASTGRSIGVTFAAGLPYIDVRLGDRARTQSMLVDTGDTQTLAIGYDEYRADTSLFAVNGNETAIGVGATVATALDGTLAHATIGDQALDAVSISAVRGQHVGHVGYGLAARCGTLIIDLQQSRIECGATSGAARTSTGE